MKGIRMKDEKNESDDKRNESENESGNSEDAQTASHTITKEELKVFLSSIQIKL